MKQFNKFFGHEFMCADMEHPDMTADSITNHYTRIKELELQKILFELESEWSMQNLWIFVIVASHYTGCLNQCTVGTNVRSWLVNL